MQADSETAAGVAVINETLARQYFGDTDALGQRVLRLAAVCLDFVATTYHRLFVESRD